MYFNPCMWHSQFNWKSLIVFWVWGIEVIGSGSDKEGSVTVSSGEKWIFCYFSWHAQSGLGFLVTSEFFSNFFPVSMYFYFCISNLNHYGILIKHQQWTELQTSNKYLEAEWRDHLPMVVDLLTPPVCAWDDNMITWNKDGSNWHDSGWISDVVLWIKCWWLVFCIFYVNGVTWMLECFLFCTLIMETSYPPTILEISQILEKIFI